MKKLLSKMMENIIATWFNKVSALVILLFTYVQYLKSGDGYCFILSVIIMVIPLLLLRKDLSDIF